MVRFGSIFLGVFVFLLSNFGVEAQAPAAQPPHLLFLAMAWPASAVDSAPSPVLDLAPAELAADRFPGGPGAPDAAVRPDSSGPTPGPAPAVPPAAAEGGQTDGLTPPDLPLPALEPLIPPEPPVQRPVLFLPIVNFASPTAGPSPKSLEMESANMPAPQPAAGAGPISLEMLPYFHSQLNETSLSNACGPTSLLIALDYFKMRASLAQVIQRSSLSPRRGGFDPQCISNPACLSPGVLAQVAEDYGLAVDAREDWTFDQLYQALAAGRPLIADVTWGLVPGGSGHFVLVYGVDPQNKLVYYHDPYSGPSRSASWNDFSASWAGPVDLGDPLRPAGHHFWGVALGAAARVP